MTTTTDTAAAPGRMHAPAPPPDPRWERPALLGLLTFTAVLYLWGLGASGWANAFYSAAAQAGSESWQALFYGSSDAANSITADKTPASLWVMALSVRLFGLSAWSILVPQALMGVAAVGTLYLTVRRWFTPGAALISGAALAVTPVAALMFRFNNPDALLVLLLMTGAYATVRAIETAGTRWLVFAATLVGFGFLTKMLQAFLVVPAFAIAYLVAAPTSLPRGLRQLALAGLALLVSTGWWVAIVELVPAKYRPYIGGSQTDSVLELTLGYNGLGRLTGDETGSVGGGMGWGQTGWTRLFSADVGGQIAWLLPAALIMLAAGLWMRRTTPRTDRRRAAYVLWGGWLLVSGLVFSFMAGIFHAYYTVALAPAVAALAGMGASDLWGRRDQLWARATLAATLAVTAAWSYVLLARSGDWQPWLRPVVLVLGLGAAIALLLAPHGTRRVGMALAATGLVVALAGPTAYAVQTAATPHSGAIPSAGPAVTAGGFGPGRAPGPADGRGFGGPPPGGHRGGGVGGPGGLLNGSNPRSELVALLARDADSYTWIAAAVGSNNASGYQLATGEPVMAIGGFNGSDPSPTLEQFQQYVADGRIHYFLGGGGMRANGGSNASQQIAEWVAANFTATTDDGTTVYDLTS